jgi:putative Mn2+ efflux pump MntP
MGRATLLPSHNGQTLIGWAAGVAASAYITAIDHWVAFALLGVIGGKMILDSLRRRIVCGDLMPGQRLPVRTALERRFLRHVERPERDEQAKAHPPEVSCDASRS